MTESSQADVETALSALDGSGSDAEWAAVEFLRQAAGDQLPSLLLLKYRAARKAGERASCVYHSMRYSRTSADAVHLAREALNDPAQAVRYRACMLLAYSQDEASFEPLRAALSKAPTNSHDDIAAAIDAIVSRNHNFFVDRDHSGKVTMNFR